MKFFMLTHSIDNMKLLFFYCYSSVVKWEEESLSGITKKALVLMMYSRAESELHLQSVKTFAYWCIILWRYFGKHGKHLNIIY